MINNIKCKYCNSDKILKEEIEEKQKEVKSKEIKILEMDKVQSPTDASKLAITNLLLSEVQMKRSDRQISNRTMREGVVFPTNEVSGWKQALPKDFKTPYEYYEDIIKKRGFFPKRWRVKQNFSRTLKNYLL